MKRIDPGRNRKSPTRGGGFYVYESVAKGRGEALKQEPLREGVVVHCIAF